MEPPVSPSERTRRRAAEVRSAHRRQQLHRRMVWLLLGIVLLFFVVIIHREGRHKLRAIEGIRLYARTIQDRVSPNGLVPLNLEPAPLPPGAPSRFALEWLDHDQARRLRKLEGERILGYTRVVEMPFRSDGRAVVFFKDGETRVEWLTVTQFRNRLEQQNARLEQLRQQERRRPLPLP